MLVYSFFLAVSISTYTTISFMKRFILLLKHVLVQNYEDFVFILLLFN